MDAKDAVLKGNSERWISEGRPEKNADLMLWYPSTVNSQTTFLLLMIDQLKMDHPKLAEILSQSILELNSVQTTERKVKSSRFLHSLFSILKSAEMQVAAPLLVIGHAYDQIETTRNHEYGAKRSDRFNVSRRGWNRTDPPPRQEYREEMPRREFREVRDELPRREFREVREDISRREYRDEKYKRRK